MKIRTSIVVALLFAGSFGLLADQGRAGRGGAPARKRVLAWADTRNGQAQHESVGHALAIIERLGYESGQWDTFIRTDSNIISKTPKKTDGSAASGGPNLGNVDAIFFMGHREVPLEPGQRDDHETCAVLHQRRSYSIFQAMTVSEVGLRRKPPPPAGTAMYCLPSLPR